MATTEDSLSPKRAVRNRRLWIKLVVAACLLIAAIPVYYVIAVSVRHGTGRELAMSPPVATEGEAGREGPRETSEAASRRWHDEADAMSLQLDAEDAAKRQVLARMETENAEPKRLVGRHGGAAAARAETSVGDQSGSSTEGTTGGGKMVVGGGPGAAPGMPGGSGQPVPPPQMPGMAAQYGMGSAPTFQDGYSAGVDYGPGMMPGGPGPGVDGPGPGEGPRYGGMYDAGMPPSTSRVEEHSAYGYGSSHFPGSDAGRAGVTASAAFSPDGRSVATASGDATGQRWDMRGSGRYAPAGDKWGEARSRAQVGVPGTEQYEAIVENEFLPVTARPLSTFSIDVDTASYANVRRFLDQGRLPPSDAVRIEEMVNYFRYDYPPPEDEAPFSVHMEVAQCPWDAQHRLLRVGLKGREIERDQRGPSNLVFLLDVSGSMADENKLPLVKQGMRLLVDQLGEDDRVAIVTYASNAGLRLESTCAADKQTILDAIDSLSAGGSTHGSAGIQLAYEQAGQHFVEGGTNRVILATDGDLNVGITDDDELVKLIQEKAKSGVFLTVLGFGAGNLKDAKMEKLADHGNGTYAYVDNLREARKVLVEQISGSLVTIAKDVKIQIEFNPAEVDSYRLIGYENRILAARDFDDDKKDAGEIGAGHTVTALYELVPAGEEPAPGEGGPMLKYQRVPEKPTAELTDQARSGELLTLRLRYKEPDGHQSKLLEFVAKDSDRRFGQASPDFQFAAAVASFGMVLRGSQYAGDLTLAAVEEFAVSGVGNDPGGYRTEFVDLVRRARQVSGR